MKHALRRNDREWLFANLPKTAKKIPISGRLLNWSARDRICAAKIPGIRKELIGKEMRPKKITKTKLLFALAGASLSLKQLSLMPKTATAIERAAESDLDIAIRRLLWEAEFGGGSTIFKVLNRATVPPRMRSIPQIARAIEKAKKLFSRRLHQNSQLTILSEVA